MSDRRRVAVRVVDHIVDELARQGTGFVFGVGGANIEDLYDALHLHPDVTGVLAKHEFAAATMADGYSRSGAGLGVVAATSGGGSLNLVAALGESLTSRVPVLALVGQPPMSADGTGAFQDTSGRAGSLDALRLFSAVALFCRRVTDPDTITELLADAIAAAYRGGPAVLLLPKDVQRCVLDATASNPLARRRYTGDVSALAGELHAISGPVAVIAGEQVARDDARAELRALGDRLGGRVLVVPDAADVAPSAPLVGVMGDPDAADAIASSAACLLVGTRLPAVARAGLDRVLADVPVLSIGSANPHVPALHVHCEDLAGSLPRLTSRVPGRSPRMTLRRSALTTPEHDGAGIRYSSAMAVLDDLLPDDADIVVDAGNSGAAAIHLLPPRPRGRYLVALGMGGMGYSFGAAIGMCFARRRRTVVIAGDGSFLMHGLELHTAVQYGLPLTAVLFNNNAHAMCITREQLYFGGDYSFNRFSPSRFGAGLATMFPGLLAVDVEDVASLRDAVECAVRHDGPAVVSVECSPDEIPPFAPFLENQETIRHVATRA